MTTPPRIIHIARDDGGTFAGGTESQLHAVRDNGTMEIARALSDHASESDDADIPGVEVYRFDIPVVTKGAREWWFTDDLSSVAASYGSDEETMADDLASEDPMRRAWAYRWIADYHGPGNFDAYPLILTGADADARYTEPTDETLPCGHDPKFGTPGDPTHCARCVDLAKRPGSDW